MSLIADGVWKAGVWATTVWAQGVWYEPAVAVVEAGGTSRRIKRRRLKYFSDPEVAPMPEARAAARPAVIAPVPIEDHDDDILLAIVKVTLQ